MLCASSYQPSINDHQIQQVVRISSCASASHVIPSKGTGLRGTSCRRANSACPHGTSQLDGLSLGFAVLLLGVSYSRHEIKSVCGVLACLHGQGVGAVSRMLLPSRRPLVFSRCIQQVLAVLVQLSLRYVLRQARLPFLLRQHMT